MIYAYLRVSTDSQGERGLGMEAQERAITQWAGGQAFTVVREVGSGGKDLPGLRALLDSMTAGDVLVVAKLDRMARSTRRFLSIVDEIEQRGCGMVALDLGIDSTTPGGRLVLTMFAALSEWERGMISLRTKEALKGVDMSRPERRASKTAVNRILQLRHRGLGYKAIADMLEAEAVPTAQGGRWWPQTVRWIYQEHEKEAATNGS